MAREQVAVVERCPIMRESLRLLLHSVGAEVVGTTESAAGAVQLGAARRLDAVVLGPAIPRNSLLANVRILRERSPAVRRVVFRLTDGAEFAVRCIEQGASAYLSQARSLDELSMALRTPPTGENAFLSPAIAAQLLAQPHPVEVLHSRLSFREFEVFSLLGMGLTVGQVATRLDISPKTVSTHRARIRAKTGLFTIEDIIRYSLDYSLI